MFAYFVCILLILFILFFATMWWWIKLYTGEMDEIYGDSDARNLMIMRPKYITRSSAVAERPRDAVGVKSVAVCCM